MKFLKFIFNLTVVSVSLFLLAGCSLLEETETFVFLVPETEDVDGWFVRFCNEEGKVLERRINGNCSLRITAGKNRSGAVLVQNKKQSFGAIYPCNKKLTAENAFSADVFISILALSESPAFETLLFLSSFNWQRFQEECKAFEDPWKLDKEKLMQAIASGVFKKTDFKLLQSE